MRPTRVLVTGAGGFIGRALVQRLAGDPQVGPEVLTLVDLDLASAPTGARRVEGDLADAGVLAAALAEAPDIVFHLASLPGGAAEADPRLSQRVNLDAPLALFAGLAAQASPPRVVYASSIAVFGAPLLAFVDDDTPPRPAMTYGAHKLMAEIALADWTRRGRLRGLALRLPGIVARPRSAGGFKSAYLSDVFHALAAGQSFDVPVGEGATAWLMSVRRCVDNLVRAAQVPPQTPAAVTLPAVRASMGELVAAIADATGRDPGLVAYAPDPALEAQFGRQPPLTATAAEAAGLNSDGDLVALVATVLENLPS